MASIQTWNKNTSAMVLDGAFYDQIWTIGAGLKGLSAIIPIQGLRWFNINLYMEPFHLSVGFDIDILWIHDCVSQGLEKWATIPTLVPGDAWYSDMKFARFPALQFQFDNTFDIVNAASFKFWFYATP